MRRGPRRLGVVAVVVTSALVLGAGIGMATGDARSGAAVNGCGNPILDTDEQGWSTLDTRTAGRRAVRDHVVARWEYAVGPGENTRPVIVAPRLTPTTNGRWAVAFDVRADRPGRARVEVDWQSGSGVLVGSGRGPWAAVPAGTAYTRVGAALDVPTGAKQGVVRIAGEFGTATTLGVTMCTYRPGTDLAAPPMSSTGTSATPTSVPPTTTTGPATTSPATTSPPTTAPPTTAPTTTAPTTTAPTTTAPTTTAPTTTAPTTTGPSPTSAVPTTTSHAPTPSAPSTTTTSVTPIQPAQPTTAAERHGWGTPLPSSDEFDYVGAPDPAKWAQAGECWPGHVGNGRRCASRTTVDGSKLVMTGLANGDTGWLASTFGTRYGRWEARVRSFATGTGGEPYHPVMIIWPDSNDWPRDGEYDFLENGSPGEACAEAFLHYPHPNLPVQQEFVQERHCGAPLSEWHNVAFEWTPDHLKGFIDGVEWFSFSGGAGPGGRGPIQGMPKGHLTIQLDNFRGSGGLQPASFEVDWVRMYAL